MLKKYHIFGFFGVILLLGFYFLILSVFNSFAHSLQQFKDMWYWIILLSLGFGTQIGIYFYIRELSIINTASTVSAAGSSAVSGSAMVACCAHHVSDFLPFIGLTGAAIFLNKYQVVFILIGIFSSILGIIYMLNMIKKHHSNFIKSGIIRKIIDYNLKFVFRTTLLFSLIILFFTIAMEVRV